MIAGVRLKVCGLTSLVDAEAADRCGADYLGFILHPRSPRFLPLAQYEAMVSRLPERRRVAVSVEPSTEDLAAMAKAGFDFFQIHFSVGIDSKRLTEWAMITGRERLWLAPRLPPEADISAEVLASAGTVLMDTFHASGFGGSGLTGDWAKFARHRVAFPDHTWILAGGLNETNIGAALGASGARIVDVNSGVESSPGVKDEAKLRRFAEALRAAAGAGRGGV
ncbi:MAG: phosphoribosylanthranilate isomerase [Opitutaceae bacterium]